MNTERVIICACLLLYDKDTKKHWMISFKEKSMCSFLLFLDTPKKNKIRYKACNISKKTICKTYTFFSIYTGKKMYKNNVFQHFYFDFHLSMSSISAYTEKTKLDTKHCNVSKKQKRIPSFRSIQVKKCTNVFQH